MDLGEKIYEDMNLIELFQGNVQLAFLNGYCVCAIEFLLNTPFSDILSVILQRLGDTVS